eukprot:g6470.t1
MRRALSVLAASTVATTAGAFNVNVNLSLHPGRGRDSAASGIAGSDVGAAGTTMTGGACRVAPAAPPTLLSSSSSSASSFSGTSRRPLERASSTSTRQGRGGPLMFGSNSEVLRDSRGWGGAVPTEQQARSSSGSGSRTACGGLAPASPFSRASAGSGLRRRKEARGRRGGEGGVAMEAYRYLNTYHDGISDEDREWNRFEEKDYVELGTSGLMVSRIGYGGMMVGGQMNEEQTHETLNHAFDVAGMNWLDTSESFPHPIIPEHAHKADPIIGSWLKGRDRSKVILCTKVAGRHTKMTWLRKDGTFPKLTRDHILESVHGSLERMGTDYIDVLSFGDWPERQTQNPGNYFWKKSDEHQTYLDFEEQLMIAQELKEQGMVRHVATAGDTAFGVTRYCEHAIWDDLPKIAFCTQEYNLFTQNKVEFDLVEACAPKQENVAIVATQTLGGGIFSGKYLFERNEWDRKSGLRLNDFAGFQGRYKSPRMRSQLEVYKDIAEKYDMSIHQMATAFVHNKPFITAALVGATNKYQIDQNIAALDTVLPEKCCRDIIAVQDADLEPMLGPSEADTKLNFFSDTVSKEFGYVDDETSRFWDRVEGDYEGP